MSEAISRARPIVPRLEHKDTVDFREVVHLFRSHLGKILLCVVVAVGAAFLYLDHVHPVYASAVLLEVTPRATDGTQPTEMETAETLKTVELKVASQSVLLSVIKAHQLDRDPELSGRSPTLSESNSPVVRWVGERLVEGLTLINLPEFAARLQRDATREGPTLSDAELVKRFQAKLDIHVVRGSRLISLTVNDRSAERAQQLAQAIIDEFFAQARNERRKDSMGAHELLMAEAKRVGDDLRTAQEKLEAYRQKYNAVSLQERQNIVVERLRELNQQVTTAKNVRLAREAELDQVRRLESANPEQLLGIRGISDLPEVIDLRKQLTAKEAELATLSQRYGPLHPTMNQAKSELEKLRSSFHATLQRATNRVRESHASARAVEQSLEAALARQEKAALELDHIAIPYSALQREVDAHNTMYKTVLEDLNKLTVAQGLAAENDANGIAIRVVEPPLVPVEPAGPRRNLLLAISLATGLFLGCGLAVGAKALDDSVTSVDAAEAALGLPVLASVPRTRHHRLNRRPVALRYPASAQAEAFRSLRTALSLSGEEEARCVLFTSAVPGEGKSFTALNTAASYTQQGLRTLLIDGDLRRPSLMGLFLDPNGRPTLTACLRDPSRLSQAIQATGIENLFALGNWHHEPGSAELVAQTGMREIIAQASGSFDRVVIDSAPLMPVSDSLYVAQHVSTVCLVIYVGKTPRRVVKRALKLLEEVSKRRPTGLVLNKVRNRTSSDHYYYYNA